MRPEEGGADKRRALFAQATDDAKHLQLVVEVKPVAAFDFHSPRALCHHLVQTDFALAVELILGRLVQQVRRIQDASSASCNLLIGKPVDLVDKLRVALPCPDDMRVGVAERGHYHSPLSVNNLNINGVHLRGQRRGRAEIGNALSLDEEPGVGKAFNDIHLEASFEPDSLRNDSRELGNMSDKGAFHRGKDYRYCSLRRNSFEALISGCM